MSETIYRARVVQVINPVTFDVELDLSGDGSRPGRIQVALARVAPLDPQSRDPGERDRAAQAHDAVVTYVRQLRLPVLGEPADQQWWPLKVQLLDRQANGTGPRPANVLVYLQGWADLADRLLSRRLVKRAQ